MSTKEDSSVSPQEDSSVSSQEDSSVSSQEDSSPMTPLPTEETPATFEASQETPVTSQDLSEISSIPFQEASLVLKKHVLLCSYVSGESDDLDYIKSHFCGNVFTKIEDFTAHKVSPGTFLYLAGNVATYSMLELSNYQSIFVIEELSDECGECDKFQLINLGQVPINVFNVGLFFRNYFGNQIAHFNEIEAQHKFQYLTESNKITNAYRQGIYLTKVEAVPGETKEAVEAASRETKEAVEAVSGETKEAVPVDTELKFKLLRCSTNFNGPTDNFREIDNEIIDQVNNIRQSFFEDSSEFNHVLAQIYNNHVDNLENDITKERKARISTHSDKTKDMPKNALIAFCSFYKDFVNDQFNDPALSVIKISVTDQFDYVYKSTSVLTTLRFKLKGCVIIPNLAKKFDIILYPNSVFLIPLSTNRFYTHEIVPATLPVKFLPTRMGYVIRCSNTDAVFKDGQTFIVKDDVRVKLEPPTEADVKELKELYLIENRGADMVFYEGINFSLNEGDYTQPII